TKNTNKKKLPKGIWLNTAGRTTNNKPGPSVGSKPNANTAGNMASPAKIDITIFMDTIVSADFDKSSFLDKYELYVTITETPTLMEKKDCPKANRIVSEFRPEKSDFRKKDKPSPI